MAQDAHLGRLNFRTVFDDFTQVFGDAVETSGAVASFGDPKPSPITVNFPIEEDTVVASQKLRRQVFGLLGNRAARAYLWFGFDQDHESDCWLMVGGGEIQVLDGASTFARWKLVTSDTFVIGRPSRYRPARRLSLTDLRSSAVARDYQQSIFSADFASLSVLALHYLPFAAADAVGVGNTAISTAAPRLTKAGNIPILRGRSDQEIVSYEQPSASRHNDSDVRIYDRRGVIAAPTTGPDPAWEEVYGPDQPLSASDVPVLDNGACRVRYDSTNAPGYRVDLWTGSAWAEQGKLISFRADDAGNLQQDNTLVGSSVLEYTPERAVLSVLMRASGDTVASRDRVLLTLQRGWTGPRIEVYPTTKSTGVKTGAQINYYVVAADTNDTLLRVDAALAGSVSASAGTGSAFLPQVQFGGSSFTGENWVAMIRQGATYAPTMAVVQANLIVYSWNDALAYGATRSFMGLKDNVGVGYVSAQIGFAPHDANQTLEAESITLGSGTTSVADAAASNGNKAQATRTADAIHVSKTTWPTAALANGRYRIFARVKTSASTLNMYAKTAATTGATTTTTSTSFVWIDLGDIFADGGTLEIHAWASAAATFAVDRIEAVKVENRISTPAYDGARDLGQSVLYEAQQSPALQER